MILGHRTLGRGKSRVLVLHDWFSDCSSYDALLPFLDTEAFTFAFADLRGYGKSKEKIGLYNLEEAVHDLLALADALHWNAFHAVGHSMTGLVVQKLAAIAENRLKSAICITPTPACGSPVPDDVLAFLENAAKSNDEGAKQIVHMMTGERHAEPFIHFKVQKWRETSTAEARAAYLHMFAKTDISNEVQNLRVPFLVLAGEYDAEGHRMPAMKETFGKWLPKCEFQLIKNSGHYPMQETPVFLSSQIDSFLKKCIDL
ncbi:MAG: hypothetical protein Tsb0015_15950 [Simkaniaceae bacterium]